LNAPSIDQRHSFEEKTLRPLLCEANHTKNKVLEMTIVVRWDNTPGPSTYHLRYRIIERLGGGETSWYVMAVFESQRQIERVHCEKIIQVDTSESIYDPGCFLYAQTTRAFDMAVNRKTEKITDTINGENLYDNKSDTDVEIDEKTAALVVTDAIKPTGGSDTLYLRIRTRRYYAKRNTTPYDKVPVTSSTWWNGEYDDVWSEETVSFPIVKGEPGIRWKDISKWAAEAEGKQNQSHRQIHFGWGLFDCMFQHSTEEMTVLGPDDWVTKQRHEPFVLVKTIRMDLTCREEVAWRKELQPREKDVWNLYPFFGGDRIGHGERFGVIAADGMKLSRILTSDHLKTSYQRTKFAHTTLLKALNHYVPPQEDYWRMPFEIQIQWEDVPSVYHLRYYIMETMTEASRILAVFRSEKNMASYTTINSDLSELSTAFSPECFLYSNSLRHYDIRVNSRLQTSECLSDEKEDTAREREKTNRADPNCLFLRIRTRYYYAMRNTTPLDQITDTKNKCVWWYGEYDEEWKEETIPFHFNSPNQKGITFSDLVTWGTIPSDAKDAKEMEFHWGYFDFTFKESTEEMVMLKSDDLLTKRHESFILIRTLRMDLTRAQELAWRKSLSLSSTPSPIR
jgi:hypothetical protein